MARISHQGAASRTRSRAPELALVVAILASGIANAMAWFEIPPGAELDGFTDPADVATGFEVGPGAFAIIALMLLAGRWVLQRLGRGRAATAAAALICAAGIVGALSTVDSILSGYDIPYDDRTAAVWLALATAIAVALAGAYAAIGTAPVGTLSRPGAGFGVVGGGCTLLVLVCLALPFYTVAGLTDQGVSVLNAIEDPTRAYVVVLALLGFLLLGAHVLGRRREAAAFDGAIVLGASVVAAIALAVQAIAPPTLERSPFGDPTYTVSEPGLGLLLALACALIVAVGGALALTANGGTAAARSTVARGVERYGRSGAGTLAGIWLLSGATALLAGEAWAIVWLAGSAMAFALGRWWAIPLGLVLIFGLTAPYCPDGSECTGGLILLYYGVALVLAAATSGWVAARVVADRSAHARG